jgi:tryptophan synthase alpha chain
MAVENRITRRFRESKAKVLSIYFTAGYPELHDTLPLCEALQESGADMIEIGVPFSDSLVDGPTIQMSNERALRNGMTLPLLFEQLGRVRERVSLPLLLMSCVNPLLCFGWERFCASCAAAGLDGVIIPDLPPEYLAPQRKLFDAANLSTAFLVTAHSGEERVRVIDGASSGFIYAVSSDATTGRTLDVDEGRRRFFKHLSEMELGNPFLVGFGITDRESFKNATEFSRGGIVGSAFIRALSQPGPLPEKVKGFVGSLR